MTVRRVLHKLLQWIRVVPVVGFNSQCYDLNVLKSLLMRRLVGADAVEDGDNDTQQRLGGCADGGSVDSFDTCASICSH